MQQEMRRKKQQLNNEECEVILNKNTSGVLAVCEMDDYPYAVPLSYVYENGKIYFHCAVTGHKLKAIRSNSKVSFCVIDQDDVVAEKYTTYYKSVIVFGNARMVEEREEKMAALHALCKKYNPNAQVGMDDKEIKQNEIVVRIIAIDIDYMSGKQALELCNK